MNLSILKSASADALAQRLAADLARHQPVFGAPVLVTGHSSTRTWLTGAVSEQNGIIANIRHIRPEDLAFEVLGHLTPGRRTMLREGILTWAIEGLLQDTALMQEPVMEDVRRYIAPQGNEGKDTSVLRLALSEKVASLFLRYAESLPTLLEAWSNGTEATPPAGVKDTQAWQRHEAWQRRLWKGLQGLAPDALHGGAPLKDALREALEAHGPDLREVMPFVACFGPLDWNTPFLETVRLLAPYTEVRIYRLATPAGLEGSHRLVKSLGKRHRETETLLEGIPVEEIAAEAGAASHEGSQEDSVLARLQETLRGGTARSGQPDDSIRMSTCPTVLLEVDALYHFLVQELEQDPSLKLSDICVVVPDTSRYAPAVKAVFPQRGLPLPHVIYHGHRNEASSPYAALEALLAVDPEAFTAPVLDSLLQFEHIRRKFGIEDEFAQPQLILESANFRHGMDGDESLETRYVSFRYAMDRLIHGHCLPPADEMGGVPTDGLVDIEGRKFYPIGRFEEGDALQIMRIYEFGERLHQWLQDRAGARKLSSWVEFIDRSIETFIDLSTYEGRGFSRVMAEWSQAAALQPEQTVSFNAVAYRLRHQLETLEERTPSGHGGIRFTGPTPHLAAPVRILAFLGMDQDSLPRLEMRPRFDLRDPEQGLTEDSDRQMFLQGLLTTRDKLYISRIGRRPKDGSVVPPSSLLEELRYALRRVVHETKALEVNHPGLAMGGGYNDPEGDPRLIRYGSIRSGREWLLQEVPKENERMLLEETDHQGRVVIDLEDLVRFFKDPVKYYYNQVLGIYLREEKPTLPGSEPHQTSPLDDWKYKAWIKERFLEGHEARMEDLLEDYRLELVRRGELPLGNKGRTVLLDCLEAVSRQWATVQAAVTLDRAREMPIHLEGKEFTIKGKPKMIYGNKLLFWTTSGDAMKYRMEAYLNALAASCALKGAITLEYIRKPSFGNNHRKTVALNIQEDPIKGHFLDLLKVYRQRGEGILFFHERFTDAQIKALQGFNEAGLDTTWNQAYRMIQDIVTDDHSMGSLSFRHAVQAHFPQEREAVSSTVEKVLQVAGLIPNLFQ